MENKKRERKKYKFPDAHKIFSKINNKAKKKKKKRKRDRTKPKKDISIEIRKKTKKDKKSKKSEKPQKKNSLKQTTLIFKRK